nr:MAG TPA: hypothetical protein [Caudoviricetes sp.]
MKTVESFSRKIEKNPVPISTRAQILFLIVSFLHMMSSLNITRQITIF